MKKCTHSDRVSDKHCRKCKAAWAKANRPKVNKSVRDWHAKNPDKAKAYRDGQRQKNALKHAERKLKALLFYSNGKLACVCCSESLFEGLTIDHIDGGGAEHRRQTKKLNIYRWLEVNGYPEGFQVLCGTCNLAKGKNTLCPHQTRGHR